MQHEEINLLKAENEELRTLHLNIVKTPAFISEEENKICQDASGSEPAAPMGGKANVALHENESNIVYEEMNSVVASVSKELEVIHVDEPLSGINTLTSNEDLITSKTCSNEGSNQNVNLNMGSVAPVIPRVTKQQKLTYAEAVEQHPISHTPSKSGEMKKTHENQNELASVSNNKFIGVERRRNKTKSFFLTGIAESVTEDQVLAYLRKRNMTPTLICIFQSRRKGTCSAKINFSSRDSNCVGGKFLTKVCQV